LARDEPRSEWTRGWVILNTLGTLAGAGVGLAAIVLSIIVLTS